MARATRNVMVTGGTRGLGLAIGKRLAAAGYTVLAVARGAGDAFAAAQAEATPGTLHHIACDLSDIDGIARLVSESRRAHGPLAALVNNAAIGTDGMLAIMPNSNISALIRLNIEAPIVLTKFVVRHMLADGAGRIVNVSSVVAFTGYSGLSVYGATKSAMLGFTRSLSREVGGSGITVNAIAPGFLDTELTGGMGEDQREQIMRRAAMKRLADLDDVARSVEFLLGEGGRSITGTTITVDAGATA